jgi:dihydroflavonol-4-reductase
MVFLTGATGFIGAHLLYHLVNQGYDVIALKRPLSDLTYVKRVFSFYAFDPELIFNRVHWRTGNILDYENLLEISRDADEIYHLSALVSFLPGDRHKLLQTNIQGTAHVINAALEHGTRKLAYISSVAALDPVREHQVITEQDFGNLPQRYTNYGESKFQSELEVWRGVEEGLNAVVINPSVVLGPFMPLKGPGALLKVIQKGISYYPRGMTGFVDVRDVCHVLLRLMQENIINERFIVSEDNHTYKDLFQMIAEKMDSKIPHRELNPFITNMAWRVERLRSFLLHQNPLITKELHQSAHQKVRFSNEKIRKTLGYQFIPLQRSIEDTLVCMNNTGQK